LSGTVLARILRIVGILVGVAAIFLAVLAGARLLEHTDSGFREMLTALSTSVLVLVTGVYVYLTYRLVRAQEQPLHAIRLAAQESAVRLLVSIIVRNQPSVAVLTNHFPLDLAQQMPPAIEPSDVDTLEKLSYEVGATAHQLPGPLVARCLETAEVAAKAYVTVTSLLSLIETFENTHAQGYWDWDEARALYADIRGSIGGPDWDDLANGNALYGADAALDGLRTELANYLQKPAG
jgi:hypothetical protein